MSCLCLPHIFTQMIVMEMIICLRLHIKKGVTTQLHVEDANGEMFYSLLVDGGEERDRELEWGDIQPLVDQILGGFTWRSLGLKSSRGIHENIIYWVQRV